jgi:hypothetical protein
MSLGCEGGEEHEVAGRMVVWRSIQEGEGMVWMAAYAMGVMWWHAILPVGWRYCSGVVVMVLISSMGSAISISVCRVWDWTGQLAGWLVCISCIAVQYRSTRQLLSCLDDI